MAEAAYVRRFSRTERVLHWTHATAFFALLVSGLVLYLPAAAAAVGRRPLVKTVHVDAAIAWIVALAAVVAFGDRRALRDAMKEIDFFDNQDRRFLCGRRSHAGRFNAGQKVNAILTSAFALLFTLSGGLLWLGERDTTFRFANTVLLHDALTIASVVLLTGHLYLSLIHPTTRHALRGMTRGTVREEWARAHHPRWVALQREAGEAGEASRQPYQLPRCE